MSQSGFSILSRMAQIAICVIFVTVTAPAFAQEDVVDDADLMVRINRLENMMRQMQGQIEELQFANQKLQEQVKFMSDSPAGRQPGQSQPALPAPSAQSGANVPPQQPPANTATLPAPANPPRSGPINLLAVGQAPQTAQAPQVPQGALSPAGSTGPGAPPMTLEQAAAAAAAGQVPVAAAPVAPAPAPAPAAPAPQQPVEQKSNFETAKDLMDAKDYERAINVLTGIVEGNPKEPKIPDAMMMLGDAQYRLKRYPEAAQRYLKLAQTYPKHPDAGLAFVRLGLSLNELGQKPQACATFAEFAKRYPSAKASVKQEADRGRKAASCG